MGRRIIQAAAALALAALAGCGAARSVTTATVNGATGILSSVGITNKTASPAYVQLQDGSIVPVAR